jgi:hypothetical protein
MTLETIHATVDPPLPPEPPIEPEPLSDATRFLSVGGYVDRDFRDQCLREVYYQNKRFVAPSYGFDLVAVLDACLRARTLDTVRDLAIVGTLGAAAYLNWISAAAVGAALVCLWVTRPAARLVRDFGARVWSGTAVDKTKSPTRGLILLLSWAAAWIVFVALASKVASAAATTFTGSRTMSGGTALLVAPVVFILPAVFGLWRQKRVEEFVRGGTPPRPRDNTRMREIAGQKDGNTVVYHNFEPFIGAGDVVTTWGFATRLVRKQPDAVIHGARPLTESQREFDEPPFSAAQIVSYVRWHLSDLTIDDIPELSIPEMTVTDRVFQSDRETLSRSLHTGPEKVAEIIQNPTGPARHYIACQVVAWGGDVVTTVHIHIAVQGRSLYLEVTTTSLAPCNERYRTVDVEGGTGPRAWSRAFLLAVRETPVTVVHAPVRLIRSLIDTTGRGSRRSAVHSRSRDHGALVSVRQLGTVDRLRNFTQRQDILKFRRLIERRVFDHIMDFLDRYDIDTAEYRAQRTSVLNVNGGVNNWGTAEYQGDVAGGDVNKEGQ